MSDQSLFEYTIVTKPSPLETDLEGALTLVARPKNGQVMYCQYLVVKIPVGVTVEALSRAAEDITADAGRWEMRPDRIKPGTGFWQQSFYNDTPDLPVNQVTIKINARPVNELEGIVGITIIESSKTEAGGNFEERTAGVFTQKAPEPFYLSYFTAKNPETGMPCLEFQSGVKLQLCWSGSKGNTYNLYLGNQKIELGSQTSYTLENGLKRSASFVLEIQRYENEHIYSTLGINITNPEVLEMKGGVKTGKIGDRNEILLNRGIVVFSDAENDWNHTIYNNGFDLDKEGPWDGMKMNVVKGLQVRTGDMNTGSEKKTVLSVGADQTEIDGQLNVKGTITAQKVSGDGVIPRGAVVMWYGNVHEIPVGWALCDGNNGTPDLRGRFVAGFSADHGDYNAIGKTGGQDGVQLGYHQMPRHAHGVNIYGAGEHYHWIEGTDADGLAKRKRRIWGETTVDMGFGGGSNKDPDDVRWRGAVNTDTCPAHSHGSDISEAGGGESHENRPAYYVLAFIMKL